jgi:hypothetical protein
MDSNGAALRRPRAAAGPVVIVGTTSRPLDHNFESWLPQNELVPGLSTAYQYTCMGMTSALDDPWLAREGTRSELRRESSAAKGDNMKAIAAPISLAGSELRETRHVCAFFNSEEEEYRVLLPFICDGFERGDKAVHVVNPDRQHDHLQRLAAAGIDQEAAQQRGQFELRTNTETYLRDGRFDPDRMLEVFEQLASGNAAGGFPLSRIVCRMDWAVEGPSHVDDLVEFESRVNDLWCRHDDAVICTYHLTKFGGETVIDIMRTHPMIIVGGILLRNPFFVPPQVFLREIRERRAQRTRPSAPAV